MKRLCIVLLAILSMSSCSKEDEPTDTRECAVRMKDLLETELKCTKSGAMEVDLYSGFYKNERVYFTAIMCPNCNTVPPSCGYTCESKKVDFDDFRNVSDVKQVYNSCTEEFME